MESRQLRYFCEIAEAGSFTAAAARLRVAQPALSRQIASLERDLGAPVFLRGPGGIKLTSHGEILLRHADAMRVHAARAREENLGVAGPDTRLDIIWNGTRIGTSDFWPGGRSHGCADIPSCV